MTRSLNARNVGSFAGALGLALFIFLWQWGFTSAPAWVIGVLLGLIAVGGGVALWDFMHERRHREEFTNFAALHGWQYLRRSREYSGRFSSFPFATGTDRHQQNVLRGRLNGVDCATFTHHFKIETGNDRKVDQAFQITLVEIPVRLPRLDLLPEGLNTRLEKAITGRDVNMESYDFNRRWHVKCDDLKYAYNFLDPRMIERLIWEDTRDMAIRVDGGAIMMWQAGRHGADDLAHRLGVLTAIARRIPTHVVRHYIELGETVYRGPAIDRPVVGPEWATKGGALTSGKYTGIVPGAPATGEGYRALPTGDRTAWGVLGWSVDWLGDWE